MPCLLVWGANDAIVPPAVGLGLASTIPDARLVVLEGAAHQPQWDAPNAFHAAVLPFLDGVSTDLAGVQSLADDRLGRRHRLAVTGHGTDEGVSLDDEGDAIGRCGNRCGARHVAQERDLAE